MYRNEIYDIPEGNTLRLDLLSETVKCKVCKYLNISRIVTGVSLPRITVSVQSYCVYHIVYGDHCK